MKKIIKKVYAIILIILMITNYMSIIVNAVSAEQRLVLKLVSDTYKYNTNDEIIVELKVAELINLSKVKVYNGNITFNESDLQLLEVVEPVGHTNTSNITNKSITISNSPRDGILGVGDTICTLKFKALKPSTTPTTIKIIESDVTCNNGSVYYEDENVNDPEITLPVESEVITHNLKITKTNESANAITNNKALFKITKLDGQVVYMETDENGIITLSNLEKPVTEAPYIYTVEEISAPEGYVKAEKPIQVTVTFDEQGNIQTAISNENGITSVINKNNTIDLKVLNAAKEPEVEKEVFNLVINKVDEQNNRITTSSAEFTVTMPDGSKANYTTNSEGKTQNIAVLAPEEAGTYTYLIKETKAPEGYIAEENNIIVELRYEKQANKIVLVSGKVVSYNDEGITIESGDVRTATVNIKNERELVTYNYRLNIDKTKNDTFKTNITEDTAMFEITANGKTQYVKTNPLGKATYQFSKTNKEIAQSQEYVYTIKEVKAPNGYVLDETQKTITITFNNDGTINTYQISGSKIEKINNTTSEVNVRVINEKEPEVIPPVPQDFELQINKKTPEGEPITVETKYTVTLPNGEQKEYSTTREDKMLPAPEKAGTYIYVLTETKTPAGYIKGNDIVLKLTFEEIDGKIVLVSGNNGVEVTEKENIKIATLNVETQKEVAQPLPPVPQNFDLVVKKVDENGNLITTSTANFVLTTPNGERNTISTVNGISSRITINAPSVAGKQIYLVQETKAPTGYDILNESLVIEANFIESEGKIVLSNAKIKEYNKEVTLLNNILTISVINTKHQAEEQPEYYTIKVSGVDRENNPIENGTTVIKLTNKLAGTYEYKEVQIKDGIIELQLPKVEGTTNYELQQIKAPDGYKTNTGSAQIAITFGKDENEKIGVNSYTVTGEDVTKGTSTDKNTVSLVIINDKIEVEPQKQNYSIEINKLDSITKEAITQGSAIFTVIDSKGTVKEYGTTDGKLIISDITPGNVGENYTFVIKEKTAPTGYKLPEETVIIKVSFEEVEGKVVITEPELIMGNSIATCQKMQTGNIKIDIINEKEDEDLYVVSKKDTAGIDIYNLFNSYTGRHYTVNEPFIDTKEAKRGNTVSVQTFINNLESNGVLTVWNEEGNQIPSDNRIKTGMILKATKGEQQKTFKIVAKGDADGDGRVRTLDLDMLIKHLTKEEVIQNPLALRALDLREESGDGIIRTTDLDEYYKVLAK